MMPLWWKELSRILHIDEASCLDISWIAFPKLTFYEINWSCARYLCVVNYSSPCTCCCMLMLPWTNPDWKSLTVGNPTESQIAWLCPCLITKHDTAWCGSWERMDGRHKYCMCFNKDMYDVSLFSVIDIQSFIDNKPEKTFIHVLHFTENITGHCMSHC